MEDYSDQISDTTDTTESSSSSLHELKLSCGRLFRAINIKKRKLEDREEDKITEIVRQTMSDILDQIGETVLLL